MARVLGLGLALIAGGWLLASFITEDQPNTAVSLDAQDERTAPAGPAHWSDLVPAEQPPVQPVVKAAP